jgi:hypothetical protein
MHGMALAARAWLHRIIIQPPALEIRLGGLSVEHE